MTTTLLVLLVGELLAPFEADFRQALPHAFPDAVPEVGMGPTAPPGRNVAWVTVQAGGQVELVLHTARVPGDLRRVLRFAAEDAPKDRAKAAAFTLAAMVRERDADLRALEAPAARLSERPWRLDLSLLGGLDLPGGRLGGGGGARLRREALSWLALGVGAEVAAFQGPGSLLLAPSLWAETAVAPVRGRFTLWAVAGGGVNALVLSREGREVTSWQPLLRLAVEGHLALGARHGLRVAVSGHLVPSRLTVQVGTVTAGTAGPAWIRPEIGYFVEL